LLHHRVADALIAMSRRLSRPDSVASAVAHHEREAGHAEVAADYFVRAGDDARAMYANADAREHFEAALALGYPDAARLHEALGDLATLAGRFAEAVVSYELAAAHCPDHATSRIETKLGGVHQRRGEWPKAEMHYAAALAALDGDGAPAVRAAILADHAVTAHRQGHTDRAGALAADALAAAERSGEEGALVQAGVVGGILALDRGDLVRARMLLGEAFDNAERLGDPSVRIAAANALARAEQATGELIGAEALLVDALALCVSIGDRHRQAALHDHLAQLLHRTGRHDEAMGHLKQAVTIFADIGSEDGDVQPEVWRLSEWIEPATLVRNDLGTAERDNGPVVAGDGPARPT
jgi:tetratricopeptide (TPR) repeat protein